MEARAIIFEQEKLNDAVIFMRGYTSALADRDDRIGFSQLRRAAELVEALVALCEAVKLGYRPFIERREADEKTLRHSLAIATKVVESFRSLIQGFSDAVRQHPELTEYWSSNQRTVEETLELFEEAEETLALGLSSGFRSEIDDARKEAGIDTDGKPRLPAR